MAFIVCHLIFFSMYVLAFVINGIIKNNKKIIYFIFINFK